MKSKLILLITFIIIIASNSFSQENIKAQKSEENIEVLVKTHLEELYGDYYQKYIGNNPEKLQQLIDFYKRCEFIPHEDISNDIVFENISTLYLKDKYNPNVIQHDNSTIFEIESFNIFKYFLNKYNSEDIYYKVYDTDIILKINKFSKQ